MNLATRLRHRWHRFRVCWFASRSAAAMTQPERENAHVRAVVEALQDMASDKLSVVEKELHSMQASAAERRHL